MAGQFLVTRGGRESFYTEGELRRLAARGQLAAGDLVYHPLPGRWLYAREVEEVKPEMLAASTLGLPPAPALEAELNGEAVAGFILGVLGYLPLVGLACCLCGLYFSSRGLQRAASMENRGHGLAIAGMVLSLAFLVPATATSALFLAALQPLF